MFGYVWNKREIKETIGLLVGEDGKLVTDNGQKTELLSS